MSLASDRLVTVLEREGTLPQKVQYATLILAIGDCVIYESDLLQKEVARIEAFIEEQNGDLTIIGSTFLRSLPSTLRSAVKPTLAPKELVMSVEEVLIAVKKVVRKTIVISRNRYEALPPEDQAIGNEGAHFCRYKFDHNNQTLTEIAGEARQQQQPPPKPIETISKEQFQNQEELRKRLLKPEDEPQRIGTLTAAMTGVVLQEMSKLSTDEKRHFMDGIEDLYKELEKWLRDQKSKSPAVSKAALMKFIRATSPPSAKVRRTTAPPAATNTEGTKKNAQPKAYAMVARVIPSPTGTATTKPAGTSPPLTAAKPTSMTPQKAATPAPTPKPIAPAPTPPSPRASTPASTPATAVPAKAVPAIPTSNVTSVSPALSGTTKVPQKTDVKQVDTGVMPSQPGADTSLVVNMASGYPTASAAGENSSETPSLAGTESAPQAASAPAQNSTTGTADADLEMPQVKEEPFMSVPRSARVSRGGSLLQTINLTLPTVDVGVMIIDEPMDTNSDPVPLNDPLRSDGTRET